MVKLCQHSLLKLLSTALIAFLAMACGLAPQMGHSTGKEGYDTKEKPMTIARLDQAANMSFEDYNPGDVIAVVNALQSLGKEKALEQINSYLERRDKAQDACGLFWVLRVLFEVPAEQGSPSVRIGQPKIPPPADPGKLPRFPIVMVQDLPFLPVKGYALGGLPEPVESSVRRCLRL